MLTVIMSFQNSIYINRNQTTSYKIQHVLFILILQYFVTVIDFVFVCQNYVFTKSEIMSSKRLNISIIITLSLPNTIGNQP